MNDVFRLCDFEGLTSNRGRRYSFIVPQYSAIYSDEWDWTNLLWYKDENQIKPILEIANRVGLFVLK